MVGKLLDAGTKQPVFAAHVLSFHDSAATVTDKDGLFRIPAHAGDTVIFTSIGYHDKAHFVVVADLNPEIREVLINPRSYQLGEVKVLPFGTYEQFRERFKDLEVTDGTIDVVGVQRPKYKETALMDDAAYWKKASTIARSPLSAAYYNLSRHEQNKREYNRLMQESIQADAKRRKYSDERLTEITGLKGDELAKFLEHIKWNEDNFVRSTDYQVISYLLQKLQEYKQKLVK